MGYGDFNGDGRPDLAILSSTSVAVLLNAGGGTFAPPQSYPTAGAGGSALAVADVTGDGRLDLVVTNTTSGTVSVLRGAGNGRFRRPVTFPAGPNPAAVAVGDFNGDHVADLAVANYYFVGQVTLSVLLGAGGGAFQAPVGYVLGTKGVGVGVGDFNGDGRDDVVVAGHGESTCYPFDSVVLLLLSAPDGSLQEAAASSANGSAGLVTVADLNGDGAPDVVVADTFALHCYEYTPFKAVVYLGDGAGALQPAGTYQVGPYPSALTTADITGDGRPDLVATNGYVVGELRVDVLAGDGAGGFLPAQSYAAGGGLAGVAAADFTGDGRPDVAAAGTGGVVLLANTGAGGLQTVVGYPAGVAPQGASAADFNGDGVPDLVVANTSNAVSTVEVLLGIGGGAFGPPISYTAGAYPQDTGVGDFNGDGHPDFVVSAFFSKAVSLFLNNGDGTFQPAKNFTLDASPEGLTVADLNADGRPDVAVAIQQGVTVDVLLNDGNGSFQPRQGYVVSDQPTDVAAADFNGDGVTDLAASSHCGGNCDQILSVLLGNGDGTFRPAVGFPGGSESANAVAAADLTGDGIPDIALATDNGLSVLPGRGDGTFKPYTLLTADDTPDVVSADFNHDGRADMAAVGFNAVVNVFLGTGNGAFHEFTYIGASQPTSVTATDLDGDGWVDLAVPDAGTQKVNVLRNLADWPPLPPGGGRRAVVGPGGAEFARIQPAPLNFSPVAEFMNIQGYGLDFHEFSDTEDAARAQAPPSRLRPPTVRDAFAGRPSHLSVDWLGESDPLVWAQLVAFP
jgi:hypothetical protein